jgi:hypothetical protein
MSGADAGAADSGGQRNRGQRTMAAVGYRQQWTATEDGRTKEAV